MRQVADFYSEVKNISFFSAILIILVSLISTQSHAQQSKDIRNYVFGNSLINHLTGDDETTVPHWLFHLAQKAGNNYSVAGQWGFLRNYASELPPYANWSFQDIPQYWNAKRQPFSRAKFNTLLISPTNFIQYQSPDLPYYDDVTKITPVEATLTVFDWIAKEQSGMTYLIYEGWADMGGFIKSFPPDNAKLGPYYEYNINESHEWYETYLSMLQTARPDLDIRLIPVGLELSKLLTQTALSQIPVTELYTDDAPHGTATLYFLASLITYTYMFDQRPPLDFNVPTTIHPVVRENYQTIVEFIGSSGGIKKAEHNTQPDTFNGLTKPSLAMGLDGIADWSVQQPFIDLMKSSREWVGHLPNQWGGWEADDLERGGYLDANGWPIIVPDELTQIETFILTNQPKETTSLTGRYRLTYKGEGTIKLSGRAKNARYKPGEIWFKYTPGEDSVGIIIKDTDPNKTGDYIRDITVVKEGNIPLLEVGAIFNPHWLHRINDLRSIRFMDWMFTNGSDQSEWSDRPKSNDYTYTRRGVPIEVMVQLANEIGADPWFNMPHLATDEYIQNFAQHIHDTLDPKLKTYVEYSNELWNFTFPQTAWALKEAETRWGETGESPWMQFVGMKAASMAAIWTDVYGEATSDRLTRVIGTHTDWPGLEQPMLHAPLWLAEDPNIKEPVSFFDAYAVTGYFGHGLGSDDKAEVILEWFRQSEKAAIDAATEQELVGRHLRAYIAEHKYDLAVTLAANDLKQNSLNALLTEALPYQSKIATKNGLNLIMYEGGTHVVGTGAWTNNDALTAFFNHLNYTPEMAEIYQVLLKGWRDVGGTMFNAFVDVANASRWGSWGALRHLDDANPRWDALAQFNMETPAWWSDRPKDTFAHGTFETGSDDGETLFGTPDEDTLIARGGNDILISAGGADKLHGGDGTDQAILPGVITDYTFDFQEEILLATGPSGTTNMASIESLKFDGQPDFVQSVSGL